MKHYICTGSCAGISGKPGTCQAEECEKRGEPLELCSCLDGQHRGEEQTSNEEE